MDHEQANLDALNKIIALQAELITFLKAENARLTASQIVYQPPAAPFTQPAYPWTPVSPVWPSQPYYGTTGDPIPGSNIIITNASDHLDFGKAKVG
jgi:hypothetical protein